MARYNGPKCRLCRRDGQKLYLKGAKCGSAKCLVVKRARPPGMHQWRRARVSQYGLRLREKQKLKRLYGVLERQFRCYFDRAARSRGNTGETLLVLLERRLDNVMFRAGLGLSRNHCRQLIVHGHVRVNSQRVTVPSYLVRVGDMVTPIPREKTVTLLKENKEINRSLAPPSWIQVATEPNLEVQMVDNPNREELRHLGVDIQEQLVVELCSR